MKEYETEINGIKTTLLLSDEDAKARGLTSAKAAKAPANKEAKPPANKDAGEKPTAATKRAEAVKSSFGQAKK